MARFRIPMAVRCTAALVGLVSVAVACSTSPGPVEVRAGGAPAGGATPAAAVAAAPVVARAVPLNPNADILRRAQATGRLAPSVKVLPSAFPVVIEQFPLEPSGVKAAFPQATGYVTIVVGNLNSANSDYVTVDVTGMPPNTTFTIFLIEQADKPFGNVEYVADLTTRGDGSGETAFNAITTSAFAMDANNPGVSKDQTGDASGVQLEHLGMWFSSLDDAKKALKDDTLKGTIFDGGNPPLHAGPQAMTDGQADPVF